MEGDSGLVEEILFVEVLHQLGYLQSRHHRVGGTDSWDYAAHQRLAVVPSVTLVYSVTRGILKQWLLRLDAETTNLMCKSSSFSKTRLFLLLILFSRSSEADSYKLANILKKLYM